MKSLEVPELGRKQNTQKRVDGCRAVVEGSYWLVSLLSGSKQRGAMPGAGLSISNQHRIRAHLTKKVGFNSRPGQGLWSGPGKQEKKSGDRKTSTSRPSSIELNPGACSSLHFSFICHLQLM